MFWVRLKDGMLERIPGDSYKESKYGHRILKGDRWIAEYSREHLVALYRNPPVELHHDLIDQISKELRDRSIEFLAGELPETDRKAIEEKADAWIEEIRNNLKGGEEQ